MLPALYLAAQVKRHWNPDTDGSRVLELAAAAALLVASCFAMLLISNGARWQMALILYAPMPALIWMALRFGVSGASAGLTLAAITAVVGSDRGMGAFAGMSPVENILILQLFVTLASLTVLCIAAVSSSRRAVTELHAALLASVDDQVATLDARGVILEVNDSWRRAADAPGAEPCHRGEVGDDYLAVCRLEAKQGHAVAACVASGLADVLARAERHFEMEYDVGEDARALRYHVSIQMLDRADGGAIVRRSDVTARHRAEREIAEQRRELSHLARVAVLGQLSGALAHELNQPLTSIRSNAETARVLLRKPVPDLGELEAILGDIVNEDQRAAEVIRRLRAMLKRGETRLQQLDLPDLIREVMVLANAELLTRRVSANVILGRELPLVLGDRVQLQQVLLNLILNACEAMGGKPPSERRLSLVVAITATDSVEIAIRDNGTGIAPMLMQRLFEPFVTNKPEGLGLGLSISRSIVASHGGRLWAENNPNGGATVHCLLRSVKSRPSGPWRIDSAMVAVKV